MRQDREPRGRAAGESSDSAKTSGSTGSVAAPEGGSSIATTSDETTSEGSAPKSTESTSGTDTEKKSAAEPGQRKRFTKKEGDGADREGRFARKEGDGAERKGRLAGSVKKVKAGSDLIRNRIASVVWLIAVLAAVALSIGALLIALGANEQNTVVEAVLDLANRIDGPFWKIFDFYTENKQGVRTGPDSVKNHLVNWGLAAVAYLIGGRILDRVIRP